MPLAGQVMANMVYAEYETDLKGLYAAALEEAEELIFARIEAAIRREEDEPGRRKRPR